jgi:PHP family Zn ribbon phosphoesterase
MSHDDDPDAGRYTNYYRCEKCNVDWEDTWSCTCNDRCPKCNAEIEPHLSEDNFTGEIIE